VNPARALTEPLRSTHSGFGRLAILAAVAVLALSLTPGKGNADPSLAEAEKNVTALSKQMAVTTEQYNAARAELADSKAKVKALGPKVARLQTQLRAREAKLSELAASVYYGGRLSPYASILQSGSPQNFFDQLAFLEQINADQRAELDALLATKKEFEAAKAKVAAEMAKQVANEKVLRDKRSAINKDLAKWQSVSVRLGGGSGNVVISTYDGPATGKAAIAVRYAYAQQGDMYEWGAAGPDTFDCSGLTMAAWARAGVSMAHSARRQYAAFPRVSLAELIPGDLVFYGSPIHHVAMYVGNGNVIHASQQGSPVQITTVAKAGGSAIAGAVRPS
jgi:peptidoglycan DL-endopeptidase CwlO